MTDVLFNYAKDNLESIVTKIIETTNELIAAYQTVSGDAVELKIQLITVIDLAKDIRSCKGMPGDLILYKLRLKLEESKNALFDFWEKEDKIKNSKSVIKKSTLKAKRFLIYAPEFKEKFEDLKDTLDKLPNELKRIKELSKSLLEPSALAYSDRFVSTECKIFWNEIAGTDIGSEKDRWAVFQKKYIQEHPEAQKWISNDWDCIRSVACVDGSELTVFGFIELTKNAGFPIDIEKVPSILDSNHSITDSSRIEVGKMINELIVKFSSEEINNHIINVHKWYGSFDRDQFKDPNIVIPKKKENETEEEKKSREEQEEAERKRVKQLKADECYRLIKRIRDEKVPYDKWTEMEKMADAVEKARRTISYFYQQFMVICEFGRLSKNILVNVDFPGKSRIKSFTGDYKPLDYANYRIIIKRGKFVEPEEWMKKQPKVYNFLERFLETSKSLQDRNEKMAEKAVRLESKEKDLNKKEKDLNEKEKRLKEWEEKLVENEKTHVEKEDNLKKKEIVNLFKKGATFGKNKEENPTKNKKDKIKESAQKKISKMTNKVEINTSNKTDDRRESTSVPMKPLKIES